MQYLYIRNVLLMKSIMDLRRWIKLILGIQWNNLNTTVLFCADKLMLREFLAMKI